METITTEGFLSRLDAGKRVFSNLDLTSALLPIGMKITGAVFSNCWFGDLNQTEFSGCKLHNIRIHGIACFATFTDCSIDKIRFGVDINRISFLRCYVERLVMCDIRVGYLEIHDTTLYLGTLSRVVCEDGRFRHVTVRNCELRQMQFWLQMVNVQFNNCDLHGAEFQGSRGQYARIRIDKKCQLQWTKALGDQLRTYVLGKYPCTIYMPYDGIDVLVAIGCQQYTWRGWERLSSKTIDRMDDGALKWWTTYKPILKQLISTWRQDQEER